MIRIQNLKEPKKTSGKKLEKGDVIIFKGVEIKNKNKEPVYVDYYKRKPWHPKKSKEVK